MKNLYKILASSIAIFAFCACSQEEIPANQADGTQPEAVTRSATGIKNIVYIEVNDMDYGIFCMHIMENPQIYENKTIKIKGKVIGRDKLIENGFVLGRQAMVCCSDDMQLLGLVCISKYAKDLIKDEWLVVDGTISLEYDESIQSNIPILHVDHLEGAKPLENEYVTFD